jgi:biopolymer transport protein ExbB
VALALIIERLIELRPVKVLPPDLLDEALAVSRHQLPSQEVIHHMAETSPLGLVLASGFQTLQEHPQCSESELQSAMEVTGRRVEALLQKNLNALATIASVAPLLGLLGTVIGMIDIFGSQNASANGMGGNPAQLAQGISMALYNTAFGLMVAIPSLMFWRYFRTQVDAQILALEADAERLLRHLNHLRK